MRLEGHYTEAVRSLLLMELCEGGVELESHVLAQPHSRLTEASLRPLAAQILDAVIHCHNAGVAHLDVQPRNLLVLPTHLRHSSSSNPPGEGLRLETHRAMGGDAAVAAAAPPHRRTATLKLIDYGSSNFFGPRAAAPKRELGDSEYDVCEAEEGGREIIIRRARCGKLRFFGDVPHSECKQHHSLTHQSDFIKSFGKSLTHHLQHNNRKAHTFGNFVSLLHFFRPA